MFPTSSTRATLLLRPVAAASLARHAAAASAARPPALRSAVAAATASPRRYNSDNVGPGRAFVEAFTSSIKRQVKENEDLSKNVKLLSDEATRISESDSIKKARELAEGGTSVTSEALKKTGKVVGKVADAVSETAHMVAETQVGKAAAATAEVVGKAAEAAVRPITESEQYKRTSEDLSAAIQAASIQYGGITSKRYRELIKRKRMLDHEMKAQIVENTEATGIVLHQDSRLKQSWAAFSASSPVAQSLIGIKNRVAESDNLVVSWGRYFAESVQDRFGGLFEETEMAKAMTLFKGLDPTFTQDGFMREAREFILPELLEAWLAGDREELARWCSEASLRVIMSPFDELTKVGMVSDCRLVELKRVDMAAAKVLDNNIPVVVVSFETQEMLVYRDKISKEVKLGKEDVVVRCFYQVVMSIEETERDPITRGWRVLEQAKSVVGSMV